MNFKKIACLLLACLPIFTAAQVQSKSFRLMLNGLLDHSVPETTVLAAAADSTQTLFLDAREWREFEVSHLAGAVWVGYGDFDLLRVRNFSKNQKIVVYCSVGYRSEKISEKLLAAGFLNVQNLVGGIFEWKNRNLPVINTAGQPTENVHAFDRIWGVWLKKGKKIYN